MTVTNPNGLSATLRNGFTYTNGSTVSPPSGLSYSSNSAIYTVGVPIPNDTPSASGGAVTSYSVNPLLPSGLALNSATGIISGTPTASVAQSSYMITASNSAG